MEKVNVVDGLFNHSHSTSLLKPKFVEWDRKCTSTHNPIIYTENNMDSAPSGSIGWILESPYFSYRYYEFVKNNLENFKHILTSDKELLEFSDKFKFAPFGGCWINEEDWGVYEKSKDFSIISSYKRETIGHMMRHDIINSSGNRIDVYGNGYKRIDNKLEGLKDYRFSFVVENCKKDYYFTEKLIDCFITGTVPIYWGCPSIGEFFDLNGMIIFEDLNDLKNKLNGYSKEWYESKKESILYNFNEAKRYVLAEDYLYVTDKSLLGL